MGDEMRRARLLAEARRRREEREVVDFAELSFGPQRAFIEDESPLVAGCTGRQAGKTDGIALKMLRTASRNPYELIPYITLSRPSAKRIMWPKLHEWNRRLGLGLKPNGTDLTMTLRNGSVIMLGGANDEAEIERYRGMTVPLVAMDEVQAFRGFAEDFITQIIIPTLWAKKGQLVIAGTPNASGIGYFARACNPNHDKRIVDANGNPTWSVHRWTGLDNPHLPDIAERWRKEREAFNLDENSPRYQREYLGRWVHDSSKLVYRIPPGCLVSELPSGNWTYYLGVDVGNVDRTAFVVVAADIRQRLYVVVESYAIEQAIPTAIMVEIDRLESRYDFADEVMDPGGGGKLVIEEYNRLHGGRLRVADKRGKHAYIEQLNGSLAAMRTLVVERANADLLEEAALLQWDWNRTVRGVEILMRGQLQIDERTSDDMLDAFLYAWRAASAPVPWDDEREPPSPGTSEWFRQEEERMFEAAQKKVGRRQDDSEIDRLISSYEERGWEDSDW